MVHNGVPRRLVHEVVRGGRLHGRGGLSPGDRVPELVRGLFRDRREGENWGLARAEVEGGVHRVVGVLEVVGPARADGGFVVCVSFGHGRGRRVEFEGDR